MRSLPLIVLLLTACAASKASPTPPSVVVPPPVASQTCVTLDVEPLTRDVTCLDEVEACLKEARSRRLFDPLDSFTPEQEELISSRGCLASLSECRARAWR